MSSTVVAFTGFRTGDSRECHTFSASGSSTHSIQNSIIRRPGTYAYRINAVGTDFVAAGIQQHSATGVFENGSHAAIYGSIYIYINSAPSGNAVRLVSLQTTGGNNVGILKLTSGRQLQLFNKNASAQIGSNSSAIALNTWVRVDVGCVPGAANTSVVTARLNGTVFATDSAQDADSAMRGLMLFGALDGSGSSCDIIFSDPLVDNAAFFADDYGVEVAVPTGDSASLTHWTASTGNKWSCLDEIPPSETDYISSSTTAGDRRYGATHATAAALGISGAIYSVKVVAIMREASSTTTLGAIGLRSGGNNYETTNVDIGTTSLVTMAALHNVDPATSAAWTASGFNAAEPLVKRSTSDTSDIRCAWLGLMVLVSTTIEVEPDPFEIEWAGATPDVVLLAEAAAEVEVQWTLGGAALASPEFRWANGGRASIERTLMWRVAPSPLRIEYALTGRTGPVTYTFRFERRTRTNQFLQDVTPAVIGGSIEGNNNRPIFRTGTFSIDANARDDRGNLITINPLADHIAVFMDLLVDGNYTLALQMGLFALTVPRKTITPGSETWEVEAYDNCIHLVDSTTTSTYTIDEGENYITGTGAAADILAAQSIPHALPSTDKTLPAPQSWPPGTPWLTIVNWLLDRVNLYQLACDATGVGRTRVRDSMSERSPDVQYQDMLLIPIAEEAETTRLANQVIAVVDDPGQPPLSAVVTNEDPANPISVTALGRTFTRTIRVDGAPDETTLEAIARNYLEREAGLYRRATLMTSIDPRREANEIYEVTAEGVYLAERWWAQSWGFQLVIGSQMAHSVGKVERITA